jgi:hypothetical protein
MQDDQGQEDPPKELPKIFPGAIDPIKGVALSYVECRNRYGIDYHTIERWVKKGYLKIVGTYTWRKLEQPLIWSEDLKQVMARQGYQKKQNTAGKWSDLVRGEYAKRELTPPPEALQEQDECSCMKPCCVHHQEQKRRQNLYNELDELRAARRQFNAIADRIEQFAAQREEHEKAEPPQETK